MRKLAWEPISNMEDLDFMDDVETGLGTIEKELENKSEDETSSSSESESDHETDLITKKESFDISADLFAAATDPTADDTEIKKEKMEQTNSKKTSTSESLAVPDTKAKDIRTKLAPLPKKTKIRKPTRKQKIQFTVRRRLKQRTKVLLRIKREQKKTNIILAHKPFLELSRKLCRENQDTSKRFQLLSILKLKESVQKEVVNLLSEANTLNCLYDRKKITNRSLMSIIYFRHPTVWHQLHSLREAEKSTR